MIIHAIITMVADDRLMMSQVMMSGSKQHLYGRRILYLGPTHKMWPGFKGGSIKTVGRATHRCSLYSLHYFSLWLQLVSVLLVLGLVAL